MRTSWRRRYLWDRGLLYERRPEADGQEWDRPGGEAVRRPQPQAYLCPPCSCTKRPGSA